MSRNNKNKSRWYSRGYYAGRNRGIADAHASIRIIIRDIKRKMAHDRKYKRLRISIVES